MSSNSISTTNVTTGSSRQKKRVALMTKFKYLDSGELHLDRMVKSALELERVPELVDDLVSAHELEIARDPSRYLTGAPWYTQRQAVLGLIENLHDLSERLGLIIDNSIFLQECIRDGIANGCPMAKGALSQILRGVHCLERIETILMQVKSGAAVCVRTAPLACQDLDANRVLFQQIIKRNIEAIEQDRHKLGLPSK
ncbi:hypothetical protein GMRT_11824 [Giardia muris]|uniref:Uncharacterized protein n=1 Tax=Giardia muris TaxID=5742 RepID=A0A4Z1T4S6_GIAMU|nr:hypothetical protein GMRT_11824 [Giardia muris]|eukprot:TNJ29003.1 hypothetical protein GMRT_11824 [Giardia muris]